MNPSGQISPGRSECISSLVDARILYHNEAVLGFVDELLIDLNSGRIAYIIGRRRDGSRTSIPWGLLEYRGGDFRLRAGTIKRGSPS